MTIDTIDPATPDPNDVAGQGDDEIRALKQVISDTFPQAPTATPADPWDIVLQVGPRAINDVVNKASDADLNALDVRVGVTELAIADHEGRITTNEGDILALQTAAIGLIDAWPVGSIFISGDGGTPAAKGLPGTWAVVGDGRFLLGGASSGAVGGSTTVTLAENQLPEHKHAYTAYREDSGSGAGTNPSYTYLNPNRSFSTHKAGRDASSGDWAEWNTDEGVNLSPSPTAVNVQNPYLTVRFYQRTA